MDWWGMFEGAATPFVGAAAVVLPLWREKKRRLRRARDMKPSQALAFGLILMGMTEEEAAAVLIDHNDGMRDALTEHAVDQLTDHINRWAAGS